MNQLALAIGDYRFVPADDDPTKCRCGASASDSPVTHDARHADYVRNIGYLLAPAALGGKKGIA